MANPKSKVLPQIIEVYLFLLITYCFDVFYPNFRGDASALGTNLYGYVMGLLCVGVAIVIKKKDIRAYGVAFKPKRILKGLYRGAIFSLIPTAIVAGLFALIYSAFDFKWAKVSFIPPNSYPAGDIGTAKATLIYAVALVFTVFAKEFFFRNYVIRTARSVYQFFDANIIQIVLCIPLPLFNHARNILFHHYYNESQLRPTLMIAVGLFWIVHEAMTAFKWGLLARVSKDIWTTFFDHYLYELIAFSLLYSRAKISDYPTMIKLLLVQAISLGMVWFYYKKKRAEKEKLKLERELARIEKRQKRENSEGHSDNADLLNERAAKSNETILENYTRGEVQKRIDDFSNANLLRHKHRPTVPKDFKDEELMDLKDINVDEFYLEYAKEIERKNQSEKDSASKKIVEEYFDDDE